MYYSVKIGLCALQLFIIIISSSIIIKSVIIDHQDIYASSHAPNICSEKTHNNVSCFHTIQHSTCYQCICSVGFCLDLMDGGFNLDYTKL